MPVHKIRWVKTLTPPLRADGTSRGRWAATGRRENMSRRVPVSPDIAPNAKPGATSSLWLIRR